MGTKIDNPFANAIANWGVDPKSAAEGQYITANTTVKNREAEILADRIAARKRLPGAGFAPGVIDAGLANDRIDPLELQRAQGIHLGRTNIVDPSGAVKSGVTPEQFAASSLLLGHGLNETTAPMIVGKGVPSKTESTLQFVPGANGEPDRIFDKATGKISLASAFGGQAAPVAQPQAAPVAPQAGAAPQAKPAAGTAPGVGVEYDKVVPPTVPGQPTTIVTMKTGANGEAIFVRSRVADQQGAQGLTQATITALMKERDAADRIQNAKAIESGDPFAWILGRRLGLIDESGNRTRPKTPLNPEELNSFRAKATEYHKAGYTMSEAFEMALKSHPGFAAGGGNLVEKEWGNSAWLIDKESDASGRELPDLGGGEFLTTKDFKQNLKKTEERSGKADNPDTPDVDESYVYKVDTTDKDYSTDRGTGRMAVPFVISALGNKDRSSVANIFATKTATPQTAVEYKSGDAITNDMLGKWVYTKGPDGNPTFGVVTKKAGGGLEVSYITGELPKE